MGSELRARRQNPRKWNSPQTIFETTFTLTAARLLSAGTKPGNNLDQCLERFLGIAPAPDQSRSDWGGMFLTDDQLAYAARDVAHLHDLAGRLDAELGGADLETVRTLEMELLPAIVAMEEAGIAMDKPRLLAIRDSSRETTKAKPDELRILLNAHRSTPVVKSGADRAAR